MITSCQTFKSQENDRISTMKEKILIKKIGLLCFSGLAAASLLTGCTNGPSDPLFDAPLGERTICSAVNPVQGSDVLSVVPFNCPDLEISTTLNELRDAGWRLETVHMGEDVEVNGTLASEVSITVRKAY